MTTHREFSPRMQTILDAAVRVTAAEGLRGLTHRAVDREAGLPQGSTSGYLRTRLALLTALSERVATTLMASVVELAESLAQGMPGDEVVERGLDLFVAWLEQPDLLMATNELRLEAVRQPAIAEVFAPFREELTGLVTQMLSQVGAAASRQRATAVIAALEGVLTAGLAEADHARSDYVRETGRTIIDAFRVPQVPSP